MLPKKNRADKKIVEKIFQQGKFFNSPNLTFRFIRTDGSLPFKISFIAPKNIAKKAVIRNRLRRLGYSALKKYSKELPTGLVGVFVFRKHQDDPLTLENEIKNILNKIN